MQKRRRDARNAEPTARARRLRHELRRLREQAGLTHSEVAHRLEWSPSKLSRIENGQSRVNAGDVIDLLGVYGISDETTREALIQLAREARRRGWWTRYTDVLGSGTYIGLEAEASAIHSYESQFVPGLLQTEDYARAVISGGQVRPDPEAAERRVAARMARQELFTRPEPPRSGPCSTNRSSCGPSAARPSWLPSCGTSSRSAPARTPW